MLQRRVIVATAGTDARKTLVGTSAVPGDTGFSGLVLPTGPTSGAGRRYSVRLASIGVPTGHVCRILDIGQLLTIAACWAIDPTQLSRQGDQGNREEDTPPCFHFERPVTTPWWTFPDGNVSWHLRQYVPNDQSDMPRSLERDTASIGLYGTGEAILYDRAAIIPMAPYSPPGAGRLPGTPVGDLGVWHDMRFPWEGTPSAQVPELLAKGPCIVSMFASVYQTDVTGRPKPAAWLSEAQINALVPEDQFLVAFPDTTRYYRIGGRMTAEICPDCEE